MKLSNDIREADWITNRLADRTYQVRMLLPPVFASYVRVLHPVVGIGPDGRTLTRWHEVAASGGLGPLDRLAHFPALAEHAGVPAPGTPVHGELATEDLDRLLPVLAGHTSAAQRCWFCIWDGYGPPADQPGARDVAPPTASRMPEALRQSGMVAGRDAGRAGHSSGGRGARQASSRISSRNAVSAYRSGTSMPRRYQ